MSCTKMEELQRIKKSKDGKGTDYGTAGAIAEEAISAIHTVTSYGGQVDIINRYKYMLIQEGSISSSPSKMILKMSLMVQILYM